MGLAVYNSITLDIRFPLCCYKKLLSPPIVPCDLNTPVGIGNVTIDDLCRVMPVGIKVILKCQLFFLVQYWWFDGIISDCVYRAENTICTL